MPINFNKTFIDTKSHKKNKKKVAFDPPVSLEVFCDPAKTRRPCSLCLFPGPLKHAKLTTRNRNPSCRAVRRPALQFHLLLPGLGRSPARVYKSRDPPPSSSFFPKQTSNHQSSRWDPSPSLLELEPNQLTKAAAPRAQTSLDRQ